MCETTIQVFIISAIIELLNSQVLSTDDSNSPELVYYRCEGRNTWIPDCSSPQATGMHKVSRR